MSPPAYGLQGVGFETFTGDGPISYWNSYVAVTQMGGRGDFSDPRIAVSVTQKPDRVAPKLAALLAYQLSLAAPPPVDFFNEPRPLAARLSSMALAAVPSVISRRRIQWQHPPYFHDGSAATLRAVVDHYVAALPLALTEAQKVDLVEFLKSLQRQADG